MDAIRFDTLAADGRGNLPTERAANRDGDRDSQCIGARVRAEGSSGIRRIRIRDFQLLSDSGPDCAGFDAGPTAAELQLGALGSCLTQTLLVEAATRHIPVDGVEVEVAGRIDPRDGAPCDIHYTLHLDSRATSGDLAALHQAVQRACPILNLLLRPQPIRGTLVHTPGSAPTPAPSPN
jgi:uncharacterized OsmC-like protein